MKNNDFWFGVMLGFFVTWFGCLLWITKQDTQSLDHTCELAAIKVHKEWLETENRWLRAAIQHDVHWIKKPEEK